MNVSLTSTNSSISVNDGATDAPHAVLPDHETASAAHDLPMSTTLYTPSRPASPLFLPEPQPASWRSDYSSSSDGAPQTPPPAPAYYVAPAYVWDAADDSASDGSPSPLRDPLLQDADQEAHLWINPDNLPLLDSFEATLSDYLWDALGHINAMDDSPNNPRQVSGNDNNGATNTHDGSRTELDRSGEDPSISLLYSNGAASIPNEETEDVGRAALAVETRPSPVADLLRDREVVAHERPEGRLDGDAAACRGEGGQDQGSEGTVTAQERDGDKALGVAEQQIPLDEDKRVIETEMKVDASEDRGGDELADHNTVWDARKVVDEEKGEADEGSQRIRSWLSGITASHAEETEHEENKALGDESGGREVSNDDETVVAEENEDFEWESEADAEEREEEFDAEPYAISILEEYHEGLDDVEEEFDGESYAMSILQGYYDGFEEVVFSSSSYSSSSSSSTPTGSGGEQEEEGDETEGLSDMYAGF